ncbi:nucleoside-diphosphate kinase [Candidatus Neoehrlichia procyonis]|uniref:Nucleoside diphosphate kinase n=1 Tax=Candidatus Neoehrlichia procyonis str. RAC413 TaxID=1359163 RepID=A0A0F3NNS8_9RICK|nr:nucleoside-diphosphate kinase [Candidatus Neoehrlichia lotoris]KJV69426.1 nucleoside diphosphate kinase [Candidatus Neoehrlichia lotoris str. RAC413]
MLERTLSILKPDVVKRNIIGNVIAYIEQAGLKIAAQKMCLLSQLQAERFYEIHKAQPFFSELIRFMVSGPVIVQVLIGDSAVTLYREVMGATDPKKAKPGSIRADFAESIDANCVHGSDNLENAKREIMFFFPECEILY